jgi:hypothetical protein
MNWVGNVACTEERINAHKIFDEKSEGRISLGRPRSGLEVILKLILKRLGVGVCGLDSSGSRYGTLASSCENKVIDLPVPYMAGNFLGIGDMLASQEGIRSVELVN